MKRNDDEKLTRLLREAGPASIPTLEPDPLLAARVRALARETPRLRLVPARRRRWVPVSLAAAAVVAALVAGGYLGYSAGSSMAAASVELAQGDSGTTDVDAFFSAWSQTGFADEWHSWQETDGETDR
jgi:hypothetical protein